MAFTIAQLQAKLDALKSIKYSGLRGLRFPDGRAADYNSVDDLQKAIADLEQEIAAAPNVTPPSFSLATHSRD